MPTHKSYGVSFYLINYNVLTFLGFDSKQLAINRSASLADQQTNSLPVKLVTSHTGKDIKK